MTSAEFLKMLSDDAVRGSIRQLSRNGEWPRRLAELRRELERRKTHRRPAA